MAASLAASLAAVAASLAPAPAAADSSAVVIMYHRFGESAYPSTNTTLQQLDAHLAELKSGAYTVLPLPEIVAAVQAGRPLPARAVGLSIDDAFLSVYRNAWPHLRASGFPFTLFVATESIDKGRAGYMSWDQIRELRDAGVTIGSQTASHPHMAAASREANVRELQISNARFKEELGEIPTLFAYPYGESSLAVAAAVKEMGFVAAFGQHSGAFGPGEDMFFLPRFAMNETFGDLDRFRLAANALPLPTKEFVPADTLIGRGENPPAVGFTVAGKLGDLSRLACYTSHQGKIEVMVLGGTRVEARMTQPLPKGRSRLNCTLPAGGGRWHWLGRQFFVAE
ncbi:MAG: polysaccharide deacetylase family protein [Hyphomicrobiales bacterium]|nr:polysaccharide deacetylase family protein [Hyphomicrobiales bacterium]MCP5372102.1 polysaccharide deacetylase family protein [Hyphomicrobiales bacterium]